MGFSKESEARGLIHLNRRFEITLNGVGGLRVDHVGSLLEQLLGNHSYWAWSTLSCLVPAYLGIPTDSKGTKARGEGQGTEGLVILFIK